VPPDTDLPTSEWVAAVTAEILSPRLALFEPGTQRDDDLKKAAQEWKTDCRVAVSITYAREFLEYEIKETERLNAMIVKQTRHCAELKT